MPPPPFAPPEAPCDAAVVCPERSAAEGILERLTGRRKLHGDGFLVVLGKVEQRRVVVATAAGSTPIDLRRLAPAVVAAHRPALLIGAGIGSAIDEKAVGEGATDGRPTGWRTAAATHVADADRPTIRLSDAIARATVDVAGGFTPSPADASAVASLPWCYDFAQACMEAGAPAALVAVLPPSEPPAAGEVRNVLSRKSLPGRAGALVRLLVKRPACLKQLWRHGETRWESETRLADAVVSVLALVDGQFGGRPEG